MNLNLDPIPNSDSSSDTCVTVDLNVDDRVFSQVVKVGEKVVTEKDLFEIGVRHIMQQRLKEEK